MYLQSNMKRKIDGFPDLELVSWWNLWWCDDDDYSYNDDEQKEDEDDDNNDGGDDALKTSVLVKINDDKDDKDEEDDDNDDGLKTSSQCLPTCRRFPASSPSSRAPRSRCSPVPPDL